MAFKMKRPWGRKAAKKSFEERFKDDPSLDDLTSREKKREIKWAQKRQMDFALEKGEVKNERQAKRLEKRSKRITKRMSKP
tara:strand:- start:58 stop:300 length:243 start_codon:yes stop_codon:yes gene_type:complete